MAFLKRKDHSKADLLRQEVAGLFEGMVVKKYKDKIVFAKPSKRPKRKPTEKQKEQRLWMDEAVDFAKRINADPVKKAAWKKFARSYTNVYQAAVSWYLKNGRDRDAIPPHEKTKRR